MIMDGNLQWQGTYTRQCTLKENVQCEECSLRVKFLKNLGSGYFAVNGKLPSETILPSVICDWSI